MFTKKATKEDEGLNKLIDQLQTRMSDEPFNTQEYATLTEQLTKLYAIKEKKNSLKRPSADTLAVVAGNLAGIIMIVGHERAHVVTSKAIGFILKAR